jgi:hypothetical protein
VASRTNQNLEQLFANRHYRNPDLFAWLSFCTGLSLTGLSDF